MEVFTFIEVGNLPNMWAIELCDCKKEMKPIEVKFVFVHNSYDGKIVNCVDNTLTDTKPEKIIEGVTGGIADHYKEVGFWKIKEKP